MKSDQVISVLGCGWLGLPLAQMLVSEGYVVKGSTTQESKLEEFKNKGIILSLIRCDPDVQGRNAADFFCADVLVVTLPFKRSFNDPSQYQKQIDSVIACVLKTGQIKFVIFTSSTSVYPSRCEDAREDAVFVPDSPRAKVLWQIERNLMNHPGFASTVVRFAGLFGPGREIGRFLAQKKDLRNPDHPVNLIHQDDAARVLFSVIERNIRVEIINACGDEHPTRKELYTKAALAKGLPSPEFSNVNDGNGKIVNNAKLKRLLPGWIFSRRLLDA